jgi:hypothetical protein
VTTLYNIACCNSILGETRSALHLLKRCFQLTRYNAEPENRKTVDSFFIALFSPLFLLTIGQALESLKNEVNEDKDLAGVRKVPELAILMDRFIASPI